MLFADDMVIVGETVKEVNEMLERVREALESKGLKINRDKTEYLDCRWKGHNSVGGEVMIENKELRKVSSYKYLGSVVQDSGEVEKGLQVRYRQGGQSGGVPVQCYVISVCH